MAERPVGVLHLILVGLPDESGPLDQLSDHVVGGFVGGPSCLEGHAAAARGRSVSYGVGVRDLRVDVFHGDAEDLRELLGHGGARAADIDRALDQAHRAVVEHVCDGAGHAGVVAAEAHPDASSPVPALERGLVVGMLLDRLHRLLGADAEVHNSVGSPRALDGCVHEPQVHGVEVEGTCDIVDRRLYRVGYYRRSRGPVGLCLGLVVNDVVGVDANVLDVVRSEHGGACAA